MNLKQRLLLQLPIHARRALNYYPLALATAADCDRLFSVKRVSVKDCFVAESKADYWTC